MNNIIISEFQKQRKKNKITLNEAEDNLKIRKSIIASIEKGDYSSFDDLFYLKYYLKKYSTFLDLEIDDRIEEVIKLENDRRLSEFDITNISANHEYTTTIRLKDAKSKNSKIKSNYFIVKLSSVLIIVVLVLFFATWFFISNSKAKNEKIQSNEIKINENKETINSSNTIKFSSTDIIDQQNVKLVIDPGKPGDLKLELKNSSNKYFGYKWTFDQAQKFIDFTNSKLTKIDIPDEHEYLTLYIEDKKDVVIKINDKILESPINGNDQYITIHFVGKE